MKKKFKISQFVQYELSNLSFILTKNSIGMSDPRDNILVTLAYGRTSMNEKSYKIVLKGRETTQTNGGCN
jgi:hypothetical protein